MIQTLGAFISRNRRFIPIAATATLFFIAYGVGAYLYEGMRDPQVFFNLFRSTPYLLISAVGETVVILTGGIDLSVSGVVALTSVASAALLRDGWNPWMVMGLMLLMGMALGATMGSFITFLKVQPFIATLAGMWFARGMCFFISDDAINIKNRVYTILGSTRLLIPGLADPVTKQGSFITILVLVGFTVLGTTMFLMQYTRFGRTVYAIGGNEHSARLMGLSVNRTKLLVYTFNGFCSALAGIVYSIYVSSGHGLYAQGFELDVIASVVMGGTMLSGGVGYVFGTLFGVLIYAVTQTLIQFNGQLSSWWTRIVIGVLTLIFIGLQSQLAGWKGRRKVATGVGAAEARRRRRMWLYGGIGTVVVVVLALIALNSARQGALGAGAETPTAASSACELQPFRRDVAENYIKDGAIISYERNGGSSCIDEIYAFYPDGRIVGDNGADKIEKQISADELKNLMVGIRDLGMFTDNIYDTWHTPCRECFGYYLTVSDNGVEKTVKAVDGGTDAPANYWRIIALINGVTPKFTTP